MNDNQTKITRFLLEYVPVIGTIDVDELLSAYEVDNIKTTAEQVLIAATHLESMGYLQIIKPQETTLLTLTMAGFNHWAELPPTR